MQISPEWQPAIDEILAEPGIAVVVGAPDSGKTTFCLQLLNAAVRSDVPAAIVDSDIGQSDIGPPGTIGLAHIHEQVEELDRLTPQKLYFVGSTTPVSHLMPTVVGTKRLVDRAQSQGAKLIVVDTTGLVRGIIGRRLKTFKIDLLQPRYLVGIQMSNEVEYLFNTFSKNEGLSIHQLKTTSDAVRKPQQYRATRRRAMFYQTFNTAEGHILRMDEIVCRNTFFGTGRPVQWRYVKEMEGILNQKLLHAESIGRGLYIVTEGQPDTRSTNTLMERYNTREISIVPASAFQNILLGLSDSSGMCMDVGLLQAVDFKQRYMFVLSKIKTMSPVKIVQFGSMRVKPDGTELGTIRAGEI